ncbi:MAG: hypothetical protein GWP19_00405 [Planctomycetia bacterium]|nr:hypothetical protein [Planctomycetia bacterium]
MAFKGKYTKTDTTTVLTDAYQKVQIQHYESKKIMFALAIFQNKTIADKGRAPEAYRDQKTFTSGSKEFDTYFAHAVLQGDGIDIIAQIYLYYKTLDDYSSIIDV